MAARNPVPSVIDYEDFNAETDAMDLYKAMKGAGTDEDTIIEIICRRSYSQLKLINDVYQQFYGRLLRDDIKSDLSGYFEKLVLTLFMTSAQQDAATIKEAVKGAGTDETAIIEVLCTRTNQEIRDIKEVYKKKYGVAMVKDLQGDTSGDFKRIVVSMCAASRDEDGPDLDPDEAMNYAQILFEKGEDQAGTNEVAFNKIFCRRGFHQLRQIFEAYLEFHPDGIEDTLNNEFGGCVNEGYKAMAMTAMCGREAFFAQKLHKAMEGLGTNEDQVLRLMVSRSRFDLKTVAARFEEKFEQTLVEYIDDDISGDYRNALLALLRGNYE